MEGRGAISHNQTGFRKGMGTMDNIYVLNYLVKKQLEKKKGRMVVMFVNIKAAFDAVDRGVLIGAMRERGLRKGLVVRVEELMRATRSKIKAG